MRIQRLTVRSFRNLKNVQLDLNPRINGFFGLNGQGKTNLLEAVYAALRGRSFRPYSSKSDWLPVAAQAPQMGAEAAGPPFISLHIKDEREYDFEARLVNGSGQKWESFLGDKRVAIARVRALVPIVAFSPDDHSLVRWEPELRRTFLDEMLTDVGPGYAESLERFVAALKSRNRLLKHFDRASSQARGELEAWSETLARCAVDILQFRREMWPSFERHFSAIAGNLFEGSNTDLKLSFVPDYEGELTTAACLEHILSGLQTDIDTGWTHRGPHRDDFRVFIQGLDSRSGASQGQSRLIALALKWTHAHWVQQERGEVPIFIVDDFSSEFDALRRVGLLSFLGATNGQVLVSGTDGTLIDSEGFSDYNFYSVQGGSVLPKRDDKKVGVLNV